jgi:predicted MFS family arabinose efflux permease
MPKIINKIIKVLIISDFFLNSGWGLMGPVFSIFIVKNIALNSISEAVQVAGFASLFYWITKSILQIPVGSFLDKNHGEKDDFWFMTISTFMMAFVPIGYLFSTQPWHIFVLQIFYGIAAAINLPSWSAIFTRHIDKGREAAEWSIHSTVLGMGAGVAAGVGGLAVASFGFSQVFIFVSIFTVVSAFLLLLIKKEISPYNKEVIRIPVERTITE